MAEKELPSVNIVLPVYNEEKELSQSVKTLYGFLTNNIHDFTWHITIVDNASRDETYTIAKKLALKHKEVTAIHLDLKGRGRAVKHAWRKRNFDILAYMDIDLSSDLKHLEALVHSLGRGYDIAIGTRNSYGSRVYKRTLLRTITSKVYILLIKMLFFVNFSDAQCGFKAVTRRVVDELLPHIKDNEWFFDSELLIVGEKSGLRIYEEPVTWIDNPGSTVRVLKTAFGDIRGLWRLFRKKPWRNIHYARR